MEVQCREMGREVCTALLVWLISPHVSITKSQEQIHPGNGCSKSVIQFLGKVLIFPIHSSHLRKACDLSQLPHPYVAYESQSFPCRGPHRHLWELQ